MKPFAIIAGDFVRTGGMDMANYALASFLAKRTELHLVSHRISPELGRSGAVAHAVWRPFGSHFLAAPLLDAVGLSIGEELARRGGRVIANGANCAFKDVNWVHYVHAAFEPRPLRGWRRHAHALFVGQERRALLRAKVVVANSRRTRDDLVERIGIAPERIRVIYYGSDPDRFRPASPAERAELRRGFGFSSDPLIAFVGALGDHRKGFDRLFEAWCRLSAAPGWRADLMVIGTGSALPSWREEAARRKAKRIHFLGFRSDVPALLRAADALVAPTRYEAYGLGVHEALCCGLPAFVSASAGVAEQYGSNNEALLLNDPEDVDELVDKLHHWHEHPEHAQSAVRAISERLRERTWNQMAEDLVAAIGE